MPLPTLQNRNHFKQYLRYFKKKFNSDIQTATLGQLRAMFSQEDTSLGDNTTVKLVLFNNFGKIDISSIVSSNDYIYFPALPGDNLTINFASNSYDLKFEGDADGVTYNGTTYTYNQQFQLGTKIFTVKALGGVLLQTEDSPSYTIIPSSTLVNEGTTVTFTVNTTAIPDNTTVYYTTTGTASASDFSDNTLTGSVVINNNTATITKTITNDFSVGEGAETFALQLRETSVSGTIVATSSTVSITDSSVATFTTSLSTTSINEGQSVTVTVNTTGIPDGSTLFYTTSNTTDVTPTSGSFTINSNTGSFSITASEDLLVETAETFTVSIRTVSISGSVVSTTNPVTIANTTTFAISSSTNIPAEGDIITLTVTTTGVPDNTRLYFTTSGAAGTSTDITPNEGHFDITNNSGTFTITTIQDFQNDDGEALDIQVRTGSLSGPIVATANTLTLTDSAFSITVTPQATIVLESSLTTNSTMIVDISSVDVPDGSQFDAVLTGTNINAKDFGGTVTFPFTINNNVSAFTIPFTRDARTEGSETFTIEVRNYNGTTVATSGVILITDVSYIGSRITNKTFGPIVVNRDNNNVANVSDWYTICGLDSVPSGSKVGLFIDNSGSMTTDTVRKSFELLLSKCQARNIELVITENASEDWITPFNKNLI